MAVTIQTRRDTAANWTLANPVLALGEIGIETDTDKAKYGDGFAAWADLPYFIDSGASVAPGTADGQTLRWEATPGEWQASDALVISDAGKVGIGTATPSQQLEVFDPATSSIIRLTCDDGSDYAEIYSDTNGVMAIDADASNTGVAANLRLRVSGTEVLRATPAGDVGIGTAGPAAKVHIATSYVAPSTGGISGDTALIVSNNNVASGRAEMSLLSRSNADTQINFGTQFVEDGAFINCLLGELSFGTGNATSSGTERIRIAAGGNVGIGETSPDTLLHLKTSTPSIRLEESVLAGSYGEVVYGGGNLVLRADEGNVASGTVMAFRVDGTEWMRLTEDGDFVVNTTAVGNGQNTAGVLLGTTPVGVGRISIGKTASGEFTVLANYSGGTFVGGINMTNVGTSLVASSDQRLKENIADAPPSNIEEIQVRTFTWKSTGDKQTYGLIAQELQEPAPYAVHHNKDEDSWGVDYAALVPMLIKSIQELRAEMAALKAQIT